MSKTSASPLCSSNSRTFSAALTRKRAGREKCGSCPKCVWFLPMHCIFCIFCIRMHHLHYNCITTAFADCISLHYAIFARDCISLHYAIFVALCNICIRCIRCILRVIAFRCIMQYLHSLHLRVIAFRCIICCIMGAAALAGSGAGRAVARVSDAPAHERRTARSGGRAVRPWEASRAPRSASTRLPRAGPVAPHHQTVAGTLPAPSRAQAPPLSRRYAIRNIWLDGLLGTSAHTQGPPRAASRGGRREIVLLEAGGRREGE